MSAKRTSRNKAAGRDDVDLELERKGEGNGGNQAYVRPEGQKDLFSEKHSSFLSSVWSRNRPPNLVTALLSTSFMKPTYTVSGTCLELV